VALTDHQFFDAPHDHVVEFYSNESELAHNVASYLAHAIRSGGVAIAIATPGHRAAFADRLVTAGIGVAGAEARGTLVWRDAAEASDWLLVGGRVARHRFEKVVGDVVREAAAGGRPVRAYGEIVAMLWAAGHITAALELEKLWNGLLRELDFSLYCAYPRAWVEAEGFAAAFAEVCRLHSAVVDGPVPPPEGDDLGLDAQAAFRWSGRSPAQARRFVIDTLAAWGCVDRLDVAALIATELATNAVLHAQTDFTVTVSHAPEGTIRIAVRDASPVRPRPRRAGPFDGSGRGLPLVGALAAVWGTDPLPGGKVVWAELGPAGRSPGGGRSPRVALSPS